MTADPRAAGLLRVALIACALAMALLVAGCSTPASSSTLPEPVAPAPWDLGTPETAVRSYLEWVSFSYRMANSEIPTATMTPGEGVRVDSYIQLNRTEGRGIEQYLETFEVTSVSQDATSAIVVARESWRYRYFSLDTLTYISEQMAASYDTTYTLTAEAPGWLVDYVEVTPLDAVR